MSRRGRPAAVRSRVAAGVGGRPLTGDETDALKRLALLYSGEARRACEDDPEGDLIPDDLAEQTLPVFLASFGHVRDWAEFLADVERLFGQYQADVAALYGTEGGNAAHASTAEECADLQAISKDASDALGMVESCADLKNARACGDAAIRLRDRLRNFPPRAGSQLTHEPARANEFESARQRLHDWLHRVREWPTYRASHARDLRTILQACEEVLGAGLTVPKWSRTEARERFKRKLRDLYRPEWDACREGVWRERVASGETLPPPRSCDEAFAESILEALAVPRESRPRKA